MLDDLRSRAAAWQMNTGKSIYWMPTAIWDGVNAAAQLCGVERVAQCLGTKPENLKNRLRLIGSPAGAPVTAIPAKPAPAQALSATPHAVPAVSVGAGEMSETETATHAVPAAKTPEQEMLCDLRTRVVGWQMRTNKNIYWMPKALWEDAIAVAELCGVERVARYLRVEPHDLRNRMRPVEPPAVAPTAGTAVVIPVTQPAAPADEFFEMPGVDQGVPPHDADALQPIAARERTGEAAPAKAPEAIPAVSVSANEALIEMLAVDGTRVSVRLPLAGFDLHAVLHQFRSRT